MDERFREALGQLNDRQRQAVETIDGPVLVIAGPGTGKTQLVSTRVGYILQNTDTPGGAILLLTFTEAGVEAMRDRLARLIGKPAYDVQLSTYHAFGGEIFRQYPDYFEGAELNLIEELSADVLLRQIIAKLPYSDPLKFADNYINDLKSFISDAKRALLTPDDIRKIAADNLKFVSRMNRTAKQTLTRLAAVSKKSVPVFEELQAVLAAYPAAKLPDSVLPLAGYAQGELAAALEHYAKTGKTTNLTEWKRYWMTKDEAGESILNGERLNRRLASAAAIYDKYQQALSRQKLYDYDDMILRAIDTLQNHPELKYSLAERYNYIMLDEFQDTNPAQFRLVQLLTDHPVNEGRPNVLAVGDDDQAIYAFQGAEHANMAAFARHYRDVKIISLKHNYRAHRPLLQAAANIAEQITSRLHHSFPEIEKQLTAAGRDLPGQPHIEARRFISDATQYAWIAREISRLVKHGVPAGEIAVLAPKHRYLTPLLPYLVGEDLAVRYERRENILDEPLVHQLERMCQLVLALADGDETSANSIWPEVLSYDFWQVPPEKIWRINWQVRESHEPWTAQLLNDDEHGYIGAFFLKLASLLPVAILEQQLDGLIGVPESQQQLNLPSRSPMYDFYFSAGARGGQPQQFTKLISDLNLLRSRLNDWRRSGAGSASLRDFIEFTEGHRAAGLNILNTSPYNETGEAVNLLTAYGAKGREFQAVFIVAALDEVWGNASRNQGYRLTLPANLIYMRYQGASEDERLRLLYVAATRARARLYLTYYGQDLAGKRFTPLKYLDITEESDRETSRILPPDFAGIKQDKKSGLQLETAASYWQGRHLPPFSQDLRQALAPRLAGYKLNPTDLNKFIDLVNAGPEVFFMECFLRFPKAPAPIAAYGTAIHNTLRFIGRIFLDEGRPPQPQRAEEILQAQLTRIELDSEQQSALLERGRPAIRQWLAQQAGSLKPTDRFEYNFQSESGGAGIARLGGVVDRLQVDEKTRQIIVIDYKIGQSYRRWAPGVIKLHNFRRQLLFYKLLVESSARFRNYSVTGAYIEFIEPDAAGRINRLELHYDNEDLNRLSRLINSVWGRIQNLDLPDTSHYPPTIGGIRAFEEDLLQENTA